MTTKKLFPGLLLGAAVLLPACSSNSPTAPPVSPTPVAYSLSLTAAPSEAVVDASILLTARVTVGGQNVPDNTTVTFRISSAQCVAGVATTPHFENLQCEMARTTQAGVATATITSQVDGSAEVTATVPGVQSKLVVRWVQPVVPATLAIYGVQPSRGRPEGGEQVTIRGRGFATPVTVDFTVGGDTRHAQVLSVNAAGSEITAITPAASSSATAEVLASIQVTAAAGTGSDVRDTLRDAFTYEKQFGEPHIYSVEPGRGSYTGGEQVTIYGINFFAPLRVTFGSEDAQIATISADNSRITVYTPRHAGAHLTQEQAVTVAVFTRFETTQQQSVSLAQGYTYLPDTGVPLLYSVVPSRGSPRGGERVTLSGRNFTAPVNVELIIAAPVGATLPATVESVASDGTQIVVVTPQASPNPLASDVGVSIRITNLVGSAASKNATFTGVFTYEKEARDLVIYSVTPGRGRASGGEQVIIRGRGFVQPVRAEFLFGGGARSAQVISVNADGTEITAVTPAVEVGTASEQIADLRVTAAAGTTIEQQTTLSGAFVFEKQFGEPRIYAVVPGRGSYAGGEAVTIFGSNLFAPLRVKLGSEDAQVVSVSADNAQIAILTPLHPGAHLTQEQPVAVTVLTRFESAQQQQVDLANGYTYLPDTGVPLLYSVSPSRGSPRGGETLVLTGKNFTPPVTVVFAIGPPVASSLPATVTNVSADGTQITLTTPQASPNPLASDALVSFTITNLVGSASSQTATFAGVFTYDKEAKDVLIYSVTPSRGRSTGGEQVVIRGRGFVTPVLIDFVVGGTARPAQLVSVSGDGLEIVAITPAVPNQTTDEQAADVRVTAAAGTTVEKVATLTGGFTFERPYAAPLIYEIMPPTGSYAGGEQVTIYGANFYAPAKVSFGAEDAQVTSVAADGSHVVVATPGHPGQTIGQNLVVDVTVISRQGTAQQQSVTRASGFTYLADFGVPLLYSVAPNRGSARGGEELLLTGRNFKGATVTFRLGAPISADRLAQVVSIASDGTTLRLVTPRASPEPLTSEVICDLVITTPAGSATFTAAFTYESETNLAIYSVVPNRGRPEGGEQVRILGRGFLAPVTVDFVVAATTRHAQVLSVSADRTEILVATPATGVDATVEQAASVTVTAAAGTANQVSDTLNAAFTYEKQYGAPQIYEVSPPQGVYVGGEQVTIFGASFFAPVKVNFGSEDAQVVSVSADASKVIVLTPRHPGQTISQDRAVDVTVLSRYATAQQQQVVRAGGFTYLADFGIPLLYSVTPNRGAARGGEELVLVGRNLQGATVTFRLGAPIGADRQAQVTSISSDGTTLHLITPQASPDPVTSEIVTDFVITTPAGSATFPRVFTYSSETDLAIYSVVPNRGRPEGGQQVRILGRGFLTPATVDFTVAGTARHAQVLAVNADGTEITVVTPATNVDASLEQVADVTVTAAAGTSNQRADTLLAAFTYEKQFGAPLIYEIAPPQGVYAGGEQLTIFGANFFAPVKVSFGAEDGQVVSVSSDASQITVTTPRHPGQTISQNLPVNVTVITRLATAQQQQVVRTGGFTYLADFGIPLLYSVTPNRGTARGGEELVLVGRNLQGAAVTFQVGAPVNAARQAQVLSISADGTTLRLLTPQASPDPVTSEAVTAFVITTPAGSATFTAVFTYEAETNLAIYSVTPDRGRPEGGEQVRILGRGFISPVTVDFLVASSVLHAQVLATNADGTEITVVTPAVGQEVTTEVQADILVTAAAGTSNQISDTKLSAFTYEKRFLAPQIYSLAPPQGIYAGGEQVIIYGASFFPPVKVSFGSEDAQVVSVSTGNDQIVLLTPRHPGQTIGQDRVVDVTVQTRFATAQQQQVVRTGGFTYLADFGIPLLYSVTPNRGSARGGEELVLVGRNFQGASVTFRLGAPISAERQAQVTSISADHTTLHLITPQASPDPVTSEVVTDLVITTPAGSATFTAVFTYASETSLAIYSVDPNRGRPEGGEQVRILGRGFITPVTVDFIVGGTTRHAQVLSVSADGAQITLVTPASNVDASVEQPANVTVTAAAGTAHQIVDTMLSAFTYEKQFSAPIIYGVSPDRGSYPGGEQVTISGASFFEPLRVTFGNENAQVVSFALDHIVVLTPTHPGGRLNQDLPVDVTVLTRFETAQQQQVVLSRGFTYLADTGVPLLYSVVPNKGSPRGGETVVLTGRNFTNPVTVDFILGAPISTTFPATVSSVSSDGTQITVVTPQASPTPVTSEVECAIRIANQVGTAQSQSATYQRAFTYESESNLAIYSVDPNRGRPEGGEQVHILGRGFITPVTVDFIVGGTTRSAQVLSVSADGAQITLVTPASNVDASVEQPADIRVTVATGTAHQIQATLATAFTYEKQFSGPIIYGLSPDRGSYPGGEQVTISGASFFEPLRVSFGSESAQVVSFTQDHIVVLTPTHPGGRLNQDLPVDITVLTRFETAQQQQVVLARGFTYLADTGVPLLYSVVPAEGSPRGGETVTLTGRNFTTPVTVDFILGPPINTTLPATVSSVSSDGTQITVVTPQASPTPVTSEVECAIRITNQVGTAQSQNATYQRVFTYSSETNLAIYSVDPNRGRPEGGEQVHILGRGFITPVTVDFIVGGTTRSAQVLSVSADGAQITLVTPASNVDAAVEQPADIRVTVATGTAHQIQATLAAAFTYEKQFSGPIIYGLSPDRGSYAGGEQVTISGASFFEPLRVSFGSESAQVVSFAQDHIVVLTPTHPGGRLNQDLPVDITVLTRFETAQQQQVVLSRGFTYLADTGVPLLYSVVPNKGSPRGGEAVALTGRNFTTPVTVDFILGPPINTTLPATVSSVSSDGTQITVVTPQASPTPVTSDVECAIRITNQVGTAQSQSATYQRVFTYTSETDLAIYSVDPDRGRPEGGEQVRILGRGFLTPVTVDLIVGGTTRHAQVLSVSADGAQITLVTPASNVDASVEQAANITVTAAAGTSHQIVDTMLSAFTYEKQFSGPVIYGLSPDRGSYAGGEQVTISGANFFDPLRVRFGNENAQVVSFAQDHIVVLTPTHPGGRLNQDLPVDITVLTRFETAQQQQVVLSRGFTYLADTGVPLLYSVVPAKGSPRGGETVVLTGRNFTTPVTVDFILGAPLSTTLPATVSSVSSDGTQITVITPQASPTPVTSEVECAIRIANQVGTAQSQSATYQRVFTYSSETNLAIYSVDPNRGRPEGGEQVRILGRGFITPVTVDFIVGGTTRSAQLLSVSADGAQITLATPASNVDATVEQPADITVTAAAGTANQIQVTLTKAFTYEKRYEAPRIYSIEPERGLFTGDELVTIHGSAFFEPIRVTIDPLDQVCEIACSGLTCTEFCHDFPAEDARVVAVSPDGATITIRTPAHPNTLYLKQDTQAAVQVFTKWETAQEQSVTRSPGFTYDSGYQVPLLYSVTPNRGSPRGGEEIVLTGRNFYNVSVTFQLGPPINAARPARIVSISPDGMTMHVITPEAAAYPVTTEVVADLVISNPKYSATSTAAFTYTAETAAAIYSVDPNRGRPEGGEQVRILGRGFILPVTVDFKVGGTTRSAQVLSVNADGTQITLVTPASNVDASVEQPADIIVTVAAGTANQVQVTLPRAFTYEKQFSGPIIYGVSPDRGSYQGGERVTISGASFFEPLRVTFGSESAQVVSFAQDHIVVRTPTHPGGRLNQDLPVDITVLTRFETAQQQQVVLARAFTYLADTGVPVLYSVVPSKGSPRGGETVALTGRNFTSPVTVDFILGAPINTTFPATVSSVSSDGTRITVVTPQASPTPVTSEVECAIRITNQVGTAQSQNATFQRVFTYESESDLAIYSVVPNRGRPEGGDQVRILGRGFITPVTVDFTVGGTTRSAQVLSVSADRTEITLVTPASNVDASVEQVAGITVTVATGTAHQAQATLAAAFTYEKQFGEPHIYSIDPETGSIKGGEHVTIFGTNFFAPVRVVFANALFGAENCQVLSVSQDGTQIEVLTPAHVQTTLAQPLSCDVTVFTRFATAQQQSFVRTQGFTYLADFGIPLLYSVTPNRGSARGGEEIVLEGRNLQGATVTFRIGAPVAAQRQAQIVSISADGTTLHLITPQASPDPVTSEAVTDFIITTPTGSATFTGVFTYEAETNLAIYSVVPNRGRPEGGEQVRVLGRGFILPVTVDFLVGGAVRHAQVLSVSADGTEVTLVTPASNVDATVEQVADILVTAAAGTVNQITDTLLASFTYEKQFGEPHIYSIDPETGSIRGGEQVTIFGTNFYAPVRVVFANSLFGAENCQVVSISQDRTQIVVLTPAHVQTYLAQPLSCDVTVFTRFATAQQQSFVRTQGFTYLADSGIPLLYSVTPDRGSARGGEEIILTGRNLQYATVTFRIGAPVNAQRQAQIVSISTDGTTLHLITPEASPNPVTSEAVTDFIITTPTGPATFTGVFTYEAETNLAIYSVVPNRGRPEGGEQVRIVGRGFIQPVTVDFLVGGATRHAQVLSVSADGTQITLVTPASNVDATVEQVAGILVTAAAGTVNQITDTLPGAFTYEKQFGEPRIYSVDPEVGSVLGGEEVTIYGTNFFPPLKVTLTNATFGAEDADVVSVDAAHGQIIIVTPAHPNTTLPSPLVCTVTVFTRWATAQQQSAVRTQGYTYLADFGIPLLYSVSPNRGSARGGDTLVLTGRNLQGARVTFQLRAPLSVAREATVLSVNAAGTELRLTTPAASSDPVTQDVEVDFLITTPAGSATFERVFTYNRDGTLAIYSVTPNRGRPEGGEQVRILGRGFVSPATVDFIVAGATRHAQVLSVNAAGTEILVATPATSVDATVEQVADIVVKVAAGTANEATDTLLSGFTYEKQFSAPVIYEVRPDRGSYAGGEQITIFGANFFTPVKVRFAAEDAEVGSISADRTQVVVLSPRHPGAHLTQDLPVDVTVLTRFETAQQQQTVLARGFTFLPDSGVPLLYSVAPATGSPRGGETVVLTGKNFTAPVNIEFILGPPLNGTLPASLISVNSAGTEITLHTPQASPTPVTSQVVCNLRITNLVGSASSQSATFLGVFTYDTESTLAIYSVFPVRGLPAGGEEVRIRGRGFIDPVAVDFLIAGTARHAQVISSTADEIRVETPPTGLDQTTEQIADVQVTAAAGTANQITDTAVAAFTYEKLFATPSIYGLIPDRGSYAGGEQIAILGANFFSPLKVRLADEEAQVVTVSADKAVVTIRTPIHPSAHLTQELRVAVTVITSFDTAQQQQVVLANGFTWVPDSGVPLLYSVTPNRGSAGGGESLVLAGKNFTSPVTVDFILGPPLSVTLPASVTDVTSDGSTITLLTPRASTSPLTSEVEVDFRIANMVGSAVSQNATYLKVFKYESESQLAIYSVFPTHGRPEGGEDVKIRGRGFVDPVQVDFLVAGTARRAQVMSVNADRTEINIKTPPTGIDQTVEHVADIRVTVAAGTANQLADTLPAAFTYDKRVAAPLVYAIDPNRGSYAGNENVTITGANLVAPVAVRLGAEDAQVVSSDETHIFIKTPQHPDSHITADQTVDVTIFTKYGTLQQQQAVVHNGFTWVPDSGVPLLYTVWPAKGTPRGGETITLTGKNFTKPVTVEFIMGAPLNRTVQANIVDVNADGTQLTLTTPQASPTPVTTDVLCNFRITNLVGSANSQNATYNGVFTYEAESRPPLIYFLLPNQGSPNGGETVKIFGRFFLEAVRVAFNPGGDQDVVSVSADGTEITVLTSPLLNITQTTFVDVTVTTQYGSGRDQQATLTDGFSYLIAAPYQPELYALTPNSGPLEGGTHVTITGAGFVYPVQVLFGDRQAQVLSVNFNQIVAVSPSITPTQPTTPTTVEVNVINMETGKKSPTPLQFRYGEGLFISDVVPNRGPMDGDTKITIYGQGFSAPLSVAIVLPPPAGRLMAQVNNVAGTEIIATTAPVPRNARTCTDQFGPVEVTNINSNTKATGPNFTYLPSQPLITAVEIDATADNLVTQYDPTNGCSTAWTSHTVIIRGFGFDKRNDTGQSAMTVRFGGIPADIPTTFVSENEVHCTLPDLTGIALNEISCLTGGGSCGLQWVDTPVSLAITNTINNCSDTLASALFIRPCVTTCRPAVPSSVTITGEPGGSVVAGSTFNLTVNIPLALTTPVTVNLSYSPSSVLNGPVSVVIPATLLSASFTVTAVGAGTGNVTATVGSGACQRQDVSNPITVVNPTLAVTLAGAGTGTVSSAPPGISCNPTCSATFTYNTSVTLTAAPTGASTFGAWTVDCASCGASLTCSVLMSASKSCTATFNP